MTSENWEKKRMDPRPEESSALLARRANMVRSRLSATLGALVRRRREALNLPLQVTRHLGLFAAVAGACLVGVIAIGIHRAAAASKRRRRERWRMLRRAWMHPEQIGRPEETILGKIARGLLIGAARLVVTHLVGEGTNAVAKSPVTPRDPARLHT
jgi:hypothetical protein